MAGLVPLIPVISQGVGLVQNLASSEVSAYQKRADQSLALRQLQERQRLQQQQLVQDTALERERISVQAAQSEEERRTALRRAVARQRANFAGGGVSASGGSSNAVLLGLFDETQDELARREQLDDIRNRALDLDVGQRNSLNLLQAEQLRQSQRISRASQDLGRVSSGVDALKGGLDIVRQVSGKKG